jgi:predicted hydrocarbon binding protein
MDNRDVVLGQIQKTLGQTLGSSAAAVMRRAGMEASEAIWPDLPGGQSVEQAGAIMTAGVKELGSFGEFKITGEEADGTAKIEFHNCYFASLAGADGLECGKQPICHFGFGLVERTFQRLTGTQTRVQLVKRDDDAGICFETARPR